MSTGVLVPLEEYLATTYHPDREYVGGELVERNVGDIYHSLLQCLLGSFVTALWAKHGPKFTALTEQRLRVREGSDSDRKYLIPDVIVIPAGLPRTPVVLVPPLVAVEILSPGDDLRSTHVKCREYLAFGVPNVWIVDPRDRLVYTVTEAGVAEVEDRIVGFECAGDRVIVDFNQIFAQMDLV